MPAALFACGVNYPVPAPDTRHSNQALKRLKASKKAEGGLFFVCGDQELDLRRSFFSNPIYRFSMYSVAGFIFRNSIPKYRFSNLPIAEYLHL